MDDKGSRPSWAAAPTLPCRRSGSEVVGRGRHAGAWGPRGRGAREGRRDGPTWRPTADPDGPTSRDGDLSEYRRGARGVSDGSWERSAAAAAAEGPEGSASALRSKAATVVSSASPRGGAPRLVVPGVSPTSRAL